MKMFEEVKIIIEERCSQCGEPIVGFPIPNFIGEAFCSKKCIRNSQSDPRIRQVQKDFDIHSPRDDISNQRYRNCELN